MHEITGGSPIEAINDISEPLAMDKTRVTTPDPASEVVECHLTDVIEPSVDPTESNFAVYMSCNTHTHK